MNAPDILIDRDIPFGSDAFSLLGRVSTFDGREAGLDPGVLGGAEVLVTRSITRIDKCILEYTPGLRVVASPTIGTDHVDFAALDDFRTRHGRPVPFFHAPGATAGGVGDHALAALCLAARARGASVSDWVVGVWGFGNCGSALARRLDAVGIRFRAYDPPLEERSGGRFVSASLDELSRCDAMSLHVPLTREGRWPTFHMVDGPALERMARLGTVLINTSRGAVVDNAALLKALDAGRGLVACLDVWEGEPAPDARLVERCLVSTPHTAGSIIEGKLRSTVMVYDAIADYLGAGPEKRWRPPAAAPQGVRIEASSFDVAGFVEAVRLERTSATFKRRYPAAGRETAGDAFEAVRAEAMRNEVVWDFGHGRGHGHGK